METSKNVIEAPIVDATPTGNRKEYLTADELMQRIEPHIRSLFR